jgi:hypothetical protein
MIDKEKSMNQPVDPVKEERWRLARRTDLATVYGVSVTVPIHGQDEDGTWRYGLRPLYGWANPDLSAEFEAEVRASIVEASTSLVDAGILSPQQVDAIEGHPYETGPSAQSWPQFFFEIYQQAEPIISGVDSLISVADVIRQIVSRIKASHERRMENTPENIDGGADAIAPQERHARVVLTLPALVALCYADLHRRHGRGGEISIVVFPRNRWAGYGSVEHPAGGETYVIRFAAVDSDYFYLVDGWGNVSEHYRTEGDDLILLPFPDLLLDDASDGQNRQPEAPLRFEVRASPLSRY